MHFIHNLHQVYGAAVRISPTEVDVADPDAYRKIHAINSGFHKAPWYDEFTDSSRPGVFAMADPKMHAARRKLLARPFAKSHLRAHWEDVVLDRVNLAVSRMEQLGKAGPVDVLQWWTFMASDVSTHLMFGEDFQTLEHGRVSIAAMVVMDEQWC
jgi:cytochrome P450